MAAANAPIAMREVLTLPSLGINQQFITSTYVTMESDKYICVRETSPQNSVVIVDMNMPNQPLRRPITADSALMHPDSKILAFKAQIQGTTQDHLQIFNIELKTKIKSHQMPEQVVFWKWISPKMLGLVTQTSVYHWSIEGDAEPAKMFDRAANLVNYQIINYRCDPTEKWLVLIGIDPGSPERPQLVKGSMQLFSVEQQRSQALEAHAASFASFRVVGNAKDSILISFAAKSVNAGQITSKLLVIELGAQPGKPSFTKKQADLFFPPDFADDFPVSMQISQKYSLIYVITKLGLLFVYDLETASAVYRNRISPDPIFLTAEASSVGGFYAINRRGQVLLATINEATLVPFVSGQLNNLELAVNLAKRGNLPGAENLTKYKEAAELATESPQGIPRTPDTVAKFQINSSLIEGNRPREFRGTTAILEKMGGDLETWVCDKLISIRGHSQPTFVIYVVGLSKEASSPSDLFSMLVDVVGLPPTSQTYAFASELFTKGPTNKTYCLSLPRKQELESLLLAMKQRTYTIVQDDDGDEDAADTLKDEDGKVDVKVEHKRQVERQISKEGCDNDSESEDEWQKDKENRQDLEPRLRERDAVSTKKEIYELVKNLTEPMISRREEKEALWRCSAKDEDGIDTLRKVSRQAYLKKMEQKKLEELRGEIEFELYVGEEVKWAEADNREMRYKKENYELVKKQTEEVDDVNEVIDPFRSWRLNG